MTAVASSLYPLVHEFLLQSGLKKTASKFESESSFTASGERSEHQRGLLEIYNLYLVNQPKPTKRKAEKELEPEAVEVVEPKKKSKKDKSAAAAEPVVAAPIAAPAVVAEEVKEKKKKSKKAKDVVEEAAAAAPAPVVEEAQLPKKSKKSKVTPAVVEDSTSSSNDDTAAAEVPQTNGKKKGSKKTPEPFQRIDPAEKLDWMPNHEFNADIIGGGTAWGAKAEAKLGPTRGKGFRHEKTKAKRGSYRGGELTNEIRSIKFD